jgi:hypothetical protein
MAGEIMIEFRGDHVHVAMGRNVRLSDEERKKLWLDLRETCEKHNTRRILVEGFIPPGEHQTSEVIEAGKRTTNVPHLWLAFHFEDFVPDERSELYEAIASNQGVRVKHFADRKTALSWLRSNAPS